MINRAIPVLILLLLAPISSSLLAAPALVSSIGTDQLREFSHQPEAVRQLIRTSLDLTRKKLTYLYGSNSPARGGMDCSGTVQYLLKSQELHHAPRQANQIHDWLSREGTLHTVSSRSFDSGEFSRLRPGDLLFWSGTYAIDRDITHVMIYLGRDKTTGKPLMVGASDGRRYNGQKRRGVSVFDFRLPRAGSKARFVGYGSIPGLVKEQTTETRRDNNDSLDGSSLVF